MHLGCSTPGVVTPVLRVLPVSKDRLESSAESGILLSVVGFGGEESLYRGKVSSFGWQGGGGFGHIIPAPSPHRFADQPGSRNRWVNFEVDVRAFVGRELRGAANRPVGALKRTHKRSCGAVDARHGSGEVATLERAWFRLLCNRWVGSHWCQIAIAQCCTTSAWAANAGSALPFLPSSASIIAISSSWPPSTFSFAVEVPTALLC